MEQLEYKYLNLFSDHFQKNKLKTLLNSKESYLEYWEKFWKNKSSQKKKSSLDVGAERVAHFIMSKLKGFKPSSIPVGSDLIFETEDAMIHMDVKTARKSNQYDFLGGKVVIGKNQTSYLCNLEIAGKVIRTESSEPELPTYYKLLPCLTYFLCIIHREDENKEEGKNIVAVLIICCPNGELKKNKQDNKIFRAGKTKKTKSNGGSLRFDWKKNQEFKLLEKKKRIIVIYIDKNDKDSKLDTLNEIYKAQENFTKN